MLAKPMFFFSHNNEVPENPKDKASEELKVFNYVSSVEKPLKWGDFKELIEVHGRNVPPMRAMWYYFLTIHRFWITHMICTYFLHYLPALIIDGLAKLTGRESPKYVYTNYFYLYELTLGDTLTRNSMSESVYLYISPLHIVFIKRQGWQTNSQIGIRFVG